MDESTPADRRIDHLETMNRRQLYALDLAASMVHLHGETCYIRDPGRILDEARKFLDRLDLAFLVTAFLLVDEADSSFVLVRCYPPEAQEKTQGLVDALVDSDQFAWALNQNRPILVQRPEAEEGTVLLHVLATKSRVRGMFVGLLDSVDPLCTPDGVVSLAMNSLLSIVFHNTAYALESAELYRLLDDLNHHLEHGMRANLFRLIDQNRELEEKVAELDRSRQELAANEEKLRIALQAADAANQAKRDFLANVSHEIRTPMNAVIGLTDMLAEGDLTPEQRRYVYAIAGAGDALLTLINDILDMSRIESGRLELDQAPFSLRELVESVRFLLEPRARQKGLAFDCRVAAGLPDLWLGDVHRIRQVLVNLLGNAVKFTSHGFVLLEVATDRGALHLTVADTGIGISEEQLPVIFHRFVQSDPSINRRFGGTGLGLAICHSLAGMMGGRIEVESVVGRGSRFHVVLPLAEAPSIMPTLSQVSPASTPARPVRLLVAEDDDVSRLLIQTYLGAIPHQVFFAEDGGQAVEAFVEGAFDLVLMDMQMPVVDGLTATTWMRRFEQERNRPRTPIVALTADAMSEQIERILQAGCDAHLSKPIKKRTLLDAIARWAQPWGIREVDSTHTRQ